jgi:hypothetical protein
MATAKEKADWEKASRVCWLLWHGNQTKPKPLEFFNPFSETPKTGLNLDRKESMEFLMKNAPVDRR